MRLDVALANAIPRISRTYASRLLKDGAILVEGKPSKESLMKPKEVKTTKMIEADKMKKSSDEPLTWATFKKYYEDHDRLRPPRIKRRVTR